MLFLVLVELLESSCQPLLDVSPGGAPGHLLLTKVQICLLSNLHCSCFVPIDGGTFIRESSSSCSLTFFGILNNILHTTSLINPELSSFYFAFYLINLGQYYHAATRIGKSASFILAYFFALLLVTATEILTLTSFEQFIIGNDNIIPKFFFTTTNTNQQQVPRTSVTIVDLPHPLVSGRK